MVRDFGHQSRPDLAQATELPGPNHHHDHLKRVIGGQVRQDDEREGIGEGHGLRLAAGAPPLCDSLLGRRRSTFAMASSALALTEGWMSASFSSKPLSARVAPLASTASMIASVTEVDRSL